MVAVSTASIIASLLNQGPLAQSVEQRTFNPWVVGSIPTGPTTIDFRTTQKYWESHDYSE